jgi:hypothetical protein
VIPFVRGVRFHHKCPPLPHHVIILAAGLSGPGWSWLVLAALGCSWLPLAASGCSWLVCLLLISAVNLGKASCLGSCAGIIYRGVHPSRRQHYSALQTTKFDRNSSSCSCSPCSLVVESSSRRRSSTSSSISSISNREY